MNIRQISMHNDFPQTNLLKKNSRSLRFDEPATKSVAFVILLYICGISEKNFNLFC